MLSSKTPASCFSIRRLCLAIALWGISTQSASAKQASIAGCAFVPPAFCPPPSFNFLLVFGFRTANLLYNNAGNTRVDEGIKAYEAGNYSLAAEKFNLVIEKKRTDYEQSEIYNLLGLSYTV